MTDAYLQQSPLAHLHLQARPETRDKGLVRLKELPFRSQFCLRGDDGDKTFRDGVESVLKLDVPVVANRVSGKPSGTHILWLGPDEWLINCGQKTVFDKLSKAVKNCHAAVVDVSDSRTILELSGTKACTVLMKGTPLDVDPAVFGPGQCASTVLEQAHVTLHHCSTLKNGSSRYHIYVHRSFADYLWRWLEDAMAEYT